MKTEDVITEWLSNLSLFTYRLKLFLLRLLYKRTLLF